MHLRTEAEARDWVEASFDVPRETMARLDQLAALVREENARQNLVSRATLETMWLRHIADSAQLLRFAPAPDCSWIDLGSGAGFPGLVIAALHGGPVTLVEERRLRAEFLACAAAALDLSAEVIGTKVERVPPRAFGAISARAFAPLPKLLALGQPFSRSGTRWLLPKGKKAQSELESLGASWQGDFRLEPSITDDEARIILAERVRRGTKA
jgi:16S rRNA (guanine527-N7)-methyltransferase